MKKDSILFTASPLSLAKIKNQVCGTSLICHHPPPSKPAPCSLCDMPSSDLATCLQPFPTRTTSQFIQSSDKLCPEPCVSQLRCVWGGVGCGASQNRISLPRAHTCFSFEVKVKKSFSNITCSLSTVKLFLAACESLKSTELGEEVTTSMSLREPTASSTWRF